MARPQRVQKAGGLYHVTTRGVRKLPIYHDDVDRKFWLATLARVVEKYHWRCHAYCLMTNHFHLLLETPEPNISAGMHLLNFRHAQWINWRHDFTGHVFERRFYAGMIESDPHFAELTRYIVLNPERAGTCRRAVDWPWSSLRATLGLTQQPDFLTTDTVLGLFAEDVTRARELYRRFIYAARVAGDGNGGVRGQAPAVAGGQAPAVAA